MVFGMNFENDDWMLIYSSYKVGDERVGIAVVVGKGRGKGGHTSIRVMPGRGEGSKGFIENFHENQKRNRSPR